MHSGMFNTQRLVWSFGWLYLIKRTHNELNVKVALTKLFLFERKAQVPLSVDYKRNNTPRARLL